MPAPRLRCLVVGASVTASGGMLTAWLLPVALAPEDCLDGVLVRLAAAVAVLAATWLVVVADLVVVAAWRGSARAPGVPTALRRMVLAACGVAVTASLVAPARAASGPQDPLPPSTEVTAPALAGLPMPDRAHGPARRSDVITVRPGDTLWDLAARHLGDPGRWSELYAANRVAIGADPDLIRPAQRLHLPTDAKEHP